MLENKNKGASRKRAAPATFSLSLKITARASLLPKYRRTNKSANENGLTTTTMTTNKVRRKSKKMGRWPLPYIQ